ncbi:MAG: hypothetical protein JWM85_232, partial [Acidimicrobiaceae bacterium]|nr:hypothetical protein [Acidimicrobiaceae bacterium]
MAVLPFDSRKLNGAWARARTFVSGFTPGQKTATGLAVLAVVVGAGIFLTKGSSPNYTTLFANLRPQDAGSIT